MPVSTAPFSCALFGALAMTAGLSLGCKEAAKTPTPEATTKAPAVAKPSPTPDTVSIVQGKLPTPEQKKTMLAAKDAMFTKLSGQLMKAIKSDGPAAAISVCSKAAPEMAKLVGVEHKLKIGRSGVRLRNPNNKAPTWANSLVEAKNAEPNFVVLSDGRAAALLPIKLKAPCLMCHGAAEQIPSPVKKQLAELYPKDEATGFKLDELRGWFWIEMDKDG